MNSKSQLAILRDFIFMMDAEDQRKVNECYRLIDDIVQNNPDCGPIALALVGLERSIEG